MDIEIDKNWGSEADSFIVTHSGKAINPLDIDPKLIVVEDIAHHLANLCRFTGAVEPFYSVGEHSVRVLRWVQKHKGNLMERKWALLHDAPEYILNDHARPLKVNPYFGKAYRGAETRAMAVFAAKFGLEGTKKPEIVELADVALFTAERRDLMPDHPIWKHWEAPEGLEIPGPIIKPWSHKAARNLWLAEFGKLYPDGVK